MKIQGYPEEEVKIVLVQEPFCMRSLPDQLRFLRINVEDINILCIVPKGDDMYTVLYVKETHGRTATQNMGEPTSRVVAKPHNP